MELAELLNFISKGNNYQEPTKEIPKEILEQYPYGQFPSNNSKEMQNKHLKKLLHNEQKNNVSAFNMPSSNTASNQQNPPQQKNNFINNLQPLISLMSNLDKKKNGNDLLNILLPLFIGKNTQLGELFNILMQKQTNKDNETKSEVNINCNEDTSNSDYKPIDSYEKI